MYCSNSCCNHISYVPLIIYKTDSVTGAGLSGAVFELFDCSGFVSRGTTNPSGLLVFCVLPCNSYKLREVSPPSGYEPVDKIYNICVDKCGCIFVDGVLTRQIVIPNTAISGSASFTAVKVNIENGEPLAGALYTLYSDMVPIGVTFSTDTGAVSFAGLYPGTYELSETAPPAGFQPNANTLPVVVAQDGSVTILGQPANGYRLTNTPIFQSEPPTINIVTEDESEITGTGLSGCTVTVIFPSGETAVTVVAADSSWSVSVPSSVTLLAGDMVSAYQTCNSFLPSNTVNTIVVAMVIPIGTINWVNLTSFENFVRAGDLLLFECFAANEGTPSSVWQSAIAIIQLPDFTSLVAGTVTISGSLASEGTGVNQYTYDSASNTLTLYLGNIAAGNSVPFSFQVRVSNEIPDYLNELQVDMTLTSLYRAVPPVAIAGRPMIISHRS